MQHLVSYHFKLSDNHNYLKSLGDVLVSHISKQLISNLLLWDDVFYWK